jgi:hypothetical protein
LERLQGTPGHKQPQAQTEEEWLHTRHCTRCRQAFSATRFTLHRNSLVKAALPELWTKGIYLYYLPPYSPEFNDIEPVFRQVKHYELPERSNSTIPALESAVDHAFSQVEEAR